MHDDTCGNVAAQATVHGQRCVHGADHVGACETAPVNEGDKHGFMWWPMSPKWWPVFDGVEIVGWTRV